MKNIYNFIFEKLKINKDSKYTEIYDWDATKFTKNDILYINPNIIRGIKKPGKPGIPSFFKVEWNNGKKIKIAILDGKIVSGDETEGEIVPYTKVIHDSKIILIKDKMAKINGYTLYLWNGNPEKFYNGNTL